MVRCRLSIATTASAVNPTDNPGGAARTAPFSFFSAQTLAIFTNQSGLAQIEPNHCCSAQLRDLAGKTSFTICLNAGFRALCLNDGSALGAPHMNALKRLIPTFDIAAVSAPRREAPVIASADAMPVESPARVLQEEIGAAFLEASTELVRPAPAYGLAAMAAGSAAFWVGVGLIIQQMTR